MRRLPIALTLAAVLGLAGCATMNVNSYVQRDLNFGQYHTFAWGPADAFPTGDPRLDNNEFFKDYMQGAVEKQLAAKGLKLAATEPDLLIHYHANVTQRFEVNERSYTNCTDDSCRPGVTDYDAGTLVIDVLDARTQKLIWRGWAQQPVNGIIGNQEWLREYVIKSVDKMMLQFPRVAV